jgi:chromosome segregation ATPase
MKTAEIKMTELHQLHKEWANKLNFYRDDIKSLEKRVEEIASKYTATEVLSMIEHFQNQIKIQRNEMDILMHDINAEEKELQENISDNPTAWDHRKAAHTTLNERMITFEKLFAEMRRELIGFAAKYM